MKIVITFIFLPIIAFVLTNIDSTIREGRFAHIRNMKIQWDHLDLLQNVSGANKSIINSIGLKGDELSTEKYRILVIGNSLSEGMLLDDTETWPYKLQSYLRSHNIDVKVYNSAKSGFMSAQRIKDVYDAYKYLNFDLIIIYPFGSYNKNYRAKEGFTEYYIPDYKNSDFSLKNNTVVQQLRNRKWEIASYFQKRFNLKLFRNAIADPNHVRGIKTSAEHRKSLPIFEMNNEYLQKYKALYQKGLNEVIPFLNNIKPKVVIINRAHVANLNPTKNDLKLWWHDTIIDSDNNEKRFSAKQYSLLIDLEHKLTNKVNSKKIKVISKDMLNPKTSWFYDQHHLNEYGSDEFAKNLSNHIISFFR